MARVVIASNRVTPPSARSGREGGLAVAVREALRRSGGLWFGWSGTVAEETPAEAEISRSGKITYATLDLGREDHAQYYTGYANSSLWPLLHYRMGLLEFERADFDGYMRVNRRFAATLAPLLKPDDIVWIHDYHLFPLGAELRALGAQNRMGFFLHTPFPPPAVMAVLPRHRLLIESVGAYDLAGFQTEGDAQNFRDCVVALNDGEHLSDGGVRASGRRVSVGTFPIGIDADAFTRMAEEAAASDENERLKESLVGRQLVFGVDRLDYSKGLPQRFEAYDRLLSRFPDQRSKVTFMQIAPVSRGEVSQYRQLRRELESLAGRINGRYAEFDWMPLRYLNKPFSRQVLAGFYRRSRVGLVTPLRDGMNLVAKEYVAAQEPANPGVLILSQFAGAAKELDAALIVNPFDVDEIAEAMNTGLTMSIEERKARWLAMIERVRGNSVSHWVDAFLKALDAVPAG